MTVEEFRENFPDCEITCKSTRKKQSNIKKDFAKTEYGRKVFSENGKKAWQKDGFREKMIENNRRLMKKIWEDSELREIRSEQVKKGINKPDVINKKKEVMRELWKKEDYRNKVVEGVKKRWEDEQYKKTLSEIHKKRYKDEGFREKHRLGVRKAVSKEKYKKKMSEIMREKWKDKEYREKVISGSGKLYIKSNGIQMYFRSSWEYIISEYLDELKIPYEYESKVFKYNHNGKMRSYIPDFYIKSLDLFLEIKPKFKLNSEEVRLKYESVRNEGYNIEFINEEHVNNIERFKELITTYLR